MMNNDAVGSATAPRACTAFSVTLRQPEPVPCALCAIAPIDAGWQVAWTGVPARGWEAIAQSMWGLHADQRTSTAYILSQSDATVGTHAFAAFVEDRLVGALIVNPSLDEMGREWLVARLGSVLGPSERFRLLAGRPCGTLSPRGPTVCFCCDVGRNEIIDAVRSGCTSIAAVGDKTRAGTNCGVCRPNVSRIVDEAQSAGAHADAGEGHAA